MPLHSSLGLEFRCPSPQLSLQAGNGTAEPNVRAPLGLWSRLRHFTAALGSVVAIAPDVDYLPRRDRAEALAGDFDVVGGDLTTVVGVGLHVTAVATLVDEPTSEPTVGQTNG